MGPEEKFYEISVNQDGDLEMLETNQTKTVDQTFAFKTDGTLVNHGNRAFYKLYLSAEQFHNYSFNSGVIKAGTIPAGIADLRTDAMKKSTASSRVRCVLSFLLYVHLKGSVHRPNFNNIGSKKL